MNIKSGKDNALINTAKTSNVRSLDIISNSIDEITLYQTKKILINHKRLKKKRIFIDAEDKKTAIAISAYRHLRTSMLKELNKFKGQVLLITGPTVGVGKTTTAINLAISIARGSQRTAMLIDLDLRRPNIHRIFNYQPKFDIIDVLQGKAKFEDILITPNINRLTLVPGKRSYEYSSELLSLREMQKLVLHVKSRYPERIVIIDAPPILGCDDVDIVSNYIDACLVVVNHQTSKQELEESLNRIKDVKIIGHVINRSKEAKFDRYYY